MRIECIDVYRVRLPLVTPFNTSYGDTAVIESVLVRAMDADGLVGWGEATPWSEPGYSPEFAAGTFQAVVRFLGPRLVGGTIDDIDRLLAALSPIKGNYFAKAAVEQAWWDLRAKTAGKPLWQVLGGVGPTVVVGADFGVMPSIDVLLEAVGGAVEAGFARIKLKFRPGWDLPMVRAVRQAFPAAVIHIDCNGAYTLADAAMFAALDPFQLAMIEQPLAHDDLIDHAALARQIATPICLDESITSPDKARKAIEIGACRWVNVKPGRVGGLARTRQIVRLCEQSGVPCWIGGMLESNIGAAHCLALATLPNVRYPSDIFPSDRFYTCDLAEPPMRLSGPSQVTAMDRPGIGFEVVEDRLRAATIESQTIRPSA